MAIAWFRLWHDFDTDPKWATIAKVSGQHITAVKTVALCVFTNASCNAVKRGVTHRLVSEDVATANQLETDQVDCILAAFQGRILEGSRIISWETRQPAREDNSTSRVKSYRSKKQQGENVTHGNAVKRNVTQGNAPDKDLDTDTDTDYKNKESTREDGSPSDFFPLKDPEAVKRTPLRVLVVEDGWPQFLVKWQQAGLPCIDEDLSDGRHVWSTMDFDARFLASQSLTDRILAGEFDEPKYHPLPKNYLRVGFKRPVRNRTSSTNGRRDVNTHYHGKGPDGL